MNDACSQTNRDCWQLFTQVKGISIIKLRRNISFPNGEITHHQMKVYADFFRQSKSKRELSLSFWLWRLLLLSIVEWITLAISLFFISYFLNCLKRNHHNFQSVSLSAKFMLNHLSFILKCLFLTPSVSFPSLQLVVVFSSLLVFKAK